MAEDKKQTTELTDLETVEVSLVDKGANRRIFAIRKSENDKMNLIDAILQAPFEKSDELIERLQKAELSEQAAEGVKSALQLLSAFQEELPESLMAELMGMIGMSEEKAEEEDEEKEEKAEDPAEEATEELAEEAAESEEETDKMYSDTDKEKEDDEDKMKKRLAGLPKEMRGMVEQLWKSNRSEIAKREELEGQIKKAEEEKRLGDFIKKARDDFSSLPAKPEELGAFMSKLDSKSAAFAQSLLKSTNELIAHGGITSEIGKSTTDAQQINSISKAEQMAAEIVKSEGVSEAVARGRVWKNNPGLYAEYQQEKGQ